MSLPTASSSGAMSLVILPHRRQRPGSPGVNRHAVVCLPSALLPQSWPWHQASASELATGTRFRVTMKMPGCPASNPGTPGLKCLAHRFIPSQLNSLLVHNSPSFPCLTKSVGNSSCPFSNRPYTFDNYPVGILVQRPTNHAPRTLTTSIRFRRRCR